jgi:hypothetical protein
MCHFGCQIKEGEMGAAYNTQQNYVECTENINFKRLLRDLTIGGRSIILKLILIKWGMRSPVHGNFRFYKSKGVS